MYFRGGSSHRVWRTPQKLLPACTCCGRFTTKDRDKFCFVIINLVWTKNYQMELSQS